jgi:predicted phosphoribosyltransferase
VRVGSPDSVERLHVEADEVIDVETPPHFSAVGQFYESVPQVSGVQAMSYLEG